MTLLAIGDKEKRALVALRELAYMHQIDMPALIERLKTAGGKAAHMKQMTAQTIAIPLAYMVTFSIENGHPAGTCRHMSMSVQKKDRVPNQHALWLVAQELGFWGSLAMCRIWPEELEGHGVAINVVQPLEQPVRH